MQNEYMAKPIRIAICDDDADERAHFYDLCRGLKERLNVPIKGKEYEHGRALLFDMEDSRIMNSVDIVLLDINMPGENGIDVARRLREYGYQGAIIFITRSNEHWRGAFDVKAFNYITKDGDLQARFNKVLLAAARQAQSRRGKVLVFSSINETRQIEVDTISHFEIANHLVKVHYNQRDVFEFASSLSKIETLLVSDEFMRVHRSFLVSVSHIASEQAGSIFMRTGAVIPVNRKSLPLVRRTLARKRLSGDTQ